MSEYLCTDEQHDVLVSLREVLHQLERTEEDVHCWKWAIIALASAVSGALTCSLSGTMQIGALEERLISPTIVALQDHSPGEAPEPRLAGPHDLLERARGNGRRERAGLDLNVSDAQDRSYKRVFEFRNEFLHFKPSGWSIELSGMPQIFADVMQIIHQAARGGWSFRHLEEAEQVELEGLFGSIANQLTRMKC